MIAVQWMNIDRARQFVATIPYDRVYTLAQQAFQMLNGWFMACYGAIEWLGGRVEQERLEDRPPLRDRIQTALAEFYAKIRQVRVENIDFSKTHGALMILSGVSGGVAALHHTGLLNLGRAHRGVEMIGNGAFLIANVVELQHSIRCFRLHAEDLEEQAGQEDINLTDSVIIEGNGNRLRVSAVLGVIKSSSYILATSLLLYGASLTYALAFVAIGLMAGGSKWGYDYFFLNLDKPAG